MVSQAGAKKWWVLGPVQAGRRARWQEDKPPLLPNRAEQGPAADALQPPLVPRSGFQARPEA